MGQNLKVNNVFGTPFINIGGSNNNTIDLYNGKGNKGDIAVHRGLKIGKAEYIHTVRQFSIWCFNTV